jgi:hypothetical protein
MTARTRKKRKRSPKKVHEVQLQRLASTKGRKGSDSIIAATKTTTMLDEMIDETIAESFPASDPPSWILGRERNVRFGNTKAQTTSAKKGFRKKTR